MQTYFIGSVDLSLFMLRLTVGVFFMLSGYNKLFSPSRHQALVETLNRDKIPFIPIMQWWVPGWELVGGALVALGAGTAFAASTLSTLMCVACWAEAAKKVEEYKPINGADRVDDYLYLPEVLYLVMLLAVLSAGPGAYSIDHIFFGG